ncbi:MAG: hypothetical protein AAF617_04340 [Bacteroidota bacterium]
MNTFLWICLCPFLYLSYAQKTPSLSQEIAFVIETVRQNQLTFQEAVTYVAPYIEKTKKKHKNELAGTLYYMLSKKAKNTTVKHTYLDSTIHATKNQKVGSKLLMKAYFLKGVVYDTERKYNLALEYYLLAQKLTEANKDIEYQYNVKFNIAFLHRRIRNYEQSEKFFKECLEFELQRDSLDILGYFNVLFQLSSTYYESEKTDACTAINKQGISFALAHDKQDLYHYFVINEGINLNIKGNYKASIDSIEKGTSYLYENDQLVAEFYLAKSYHQLGEAEKSLQYFQKIDTVFQQTNNLLPALRPTYEYLITAAKKN